MAGFVGAGDLAFDGHDSAVRSEGIEVEFEEGLGLVQALAREILHAKGWDWGRAPPQSMPLRKKFVILALLTRAIRQARPRFQDSKVTSTGQAESLVRSRPWACSGHQR